MVEVHGCLGGIWTAGALGWLLDHANKKGFMQELLDRLARSEGLTLGHWARWPTTNPRFEPAETLVVDFLREHGFIERE